MKAFILYLVLSVTSLCTSHLMAQTVPHRIFDHQLRLIDSLKTFVTDELHMDVPSNFYTDWQEPMADTMFCFLYLSFADRVDPDTSLRIPRFFSDESLAKTAEKDMKARGYHTMLYKTAGMSSALLSRKLVSYPDEAIAFIIFHEVTHRNLQKAGSPVPYVYEEALCDVIANRACRLFADKTHLIYASRIEKQRKIFEEAYSFMNEKRKKLDSTPQADKQKLFDKCTKKLVALTAHANQFQKDRMRYDVNNAYFLRINDYATHYFEIKSMFGEKFDLQQAISRIRALQKK